MKLELEIMERFLSLCSHVLIMLVHVQISVALFLNECPEKLMWNLRAEQLCGVADKYMCLYDTNKRKFRELCKNGPEFHRPGNIFVISGNLQYFAGRQCYGNRYQPHKWWTNGSSECQYIKSSCNGEGQVPYDNGTIASDRKCRCDYTNYYTLVSSTKKKCYCDPIEEDCSCYSKRCNADQVLTPDYDCVGIHEWSGRFVCPEYKPPKIIDDKQGATLCPTIQKDSYGTIKRSYVRIAVSLLFGVLVILGLIIFAFVKLRKIWQDDIQDLTNNLFPDYFLDDPSNIECIEGEDASLTCKIRLGSPPAKWFHNDIEIMQNDHHIMSTDYKEQTRYTQLTLKYTTTSDSGEYRVEVGNMSRKVQVQIKDFFLAESPDICCMEGEDAILTCTVHPGSAPVTWFKEGNKIMENKYKTISQVETEHELKNLLTLKNTKTSDSGVYHVQVGNMLRRVQVQIKETPSVHEKNTYMEAITTGKEVKQYVRINVVGKDRVGKSSLVRRLLGKTIDDVKSTDGIEINKTCQIRTSDGKWIVKEELTEREKIERRILHAVNIKRGDKELVANQRRLSEDRDFETITKQDGHKRDPSEDHLLPEENNENQTFTTDEKNLLPVVENKPCLSNEQNNITEPLDTDVVSKKKDDDSCTRHTKQNSERSSYSPLTITDTIYSSTDKTIQTSENPSHIHSDIDDQLTEAMIDSMDEILLEVKNKKEKHSSDGLVDCGIWDFAGQKDYYVTHQTFLTPHAIYLIVADITEDIKPYQYDDAFNYDSIGEYIDFWLDSIHCFCEDIQESAANELRPPVIMVCTGIDKVPNKHRETQKRKYVRRFIESFGCQIVGRHTRGMIHFISNIESPQEDFETLRKHISETAREMHFFAKEVPTRWIQLENALSVLKDLKGQKKMGYCERWENIEKLAQRFSIEKDELIHFLKDQHNIGHIIFFEDKHDYIILEPNWLVNCFRCLVCDDDKKPCTLHEMYELKHSGQLSDQLIDKLFSKEPELMFREYKNHILDVIEKFDIIIKSKSTNSYYMPCLIENSSTLPDIMRTFNVAHTNCTPWLVLEFKFLPIVYFNNIMFNYIKEKAVCKKMSQAGDKLPAIYAGKAVVYADDTKSRKLIICFSRNAISVQMWNNNDVDGDTYRQIIEELCHNIEILETKFNHKLQYKIKSKCSTGDYCSTSGRFSFKDLTQMYEGEHYFCEEHCCIHNKHDIENTWFKHAVAENRELNGMNDDCADY